MRSEVLALRESGLSYQEIANKLEISRRTVKSWVRRQVEHPKKRETFYVVTDND
jgi:DNA-directed RNA polymerase specialized sigma24 family protein